MIRLLFKLFMAVGILGALTGVALAAGDPVAGKAKFATCAGCHAIPGYTNVYPTYHVPRLGGQHPEYIVAALKAYQAGERQHPTMHANASPLSDQDQQDIAAYLAGVKTVETPSPIRGNAEAGKAKSAACAACHGADGNSVVNLYPRLSGQHEDYLHKVLADYQSGKRKNAIMQGMAAPLSLQDIADLAAYFASQAKGLTVVGQD